MLLGFMTCMVMYGNGLKIVGMETILERHLMEVPGLMEVVQAELLGVAHGSLTFSGVELLAEMVTILLIAIDMAVFVLQGRCKCLKLN